MSGHFTEMIGKQIECILSKYQELFLCQELLLNWNSKLQGHLLKTNKLNWTLFCIF